MIKPILCAVEFCVFYFGILESFFNIFMCSQKANCLQHHLELPNRHFESHWRFCLIDWKPLRVTTSPSYLSTRTFHFYFTDWDWFNRKSFKLIKFLVVRIYKRNTSWEWNFFLFFRLLALARIDIRRTNTSCTNTLFFVGIEGHASTRT